jgi:hypothetical protein
MRVAGFLSSSRDNRCVNSSDAPATRVAVATNKVKHRSGGPTAGPAPIPWGPWTRMRPASAPGAQHTSTQVRPVRPPTCYGCWVLVEYVAHQLVEGGVHEGGRARGTLIQHAAQGPQVARCRVSGSLTEQLGRHVAGRPALCLCCRQNKKTWGHNMGRGRKQRVRLGVTANTSSTCGSPDATMLFLFRQQANLRS